MSDIEFAISCGVVLRGEELDPEFVTKALGITPTSFGRKGELRQISSNKNVVNRIGHWAFTVHDDATAFEAAFERALAPFDGVNVDLSSLPGVRDAFFDIFGTGYRTEEDDSGLFTLSDRQVAKLACLRLTVEVSMSIFDRPDGATD